MKQSASQGGLALPDLTLYYEASNLGNVMKALRPVSSRLAAYWGDLYSSSFDSRILVEFFQTPSTAVSPKSISEDFLKIWNMRQNLLAPTLSRFSCFTNQSTPGKNNASYKIWRDSHLTWLEDLLDKNKPLDKHQLDQKLWTNIPWFCYLQLTSLLQFLISKQYLKRQLTSFELMLHSRMHATKGIISALYNLLLEYDASRPLTSWTRWQTDCPNSITAEDWPRLWTAPCFCSLVFSICIQAIKTCYVGIIPDHSFHMKKLPSPLCWKGCDTRGAYVHSWWGCTPINTFWDLILKEVRDNIGILLPSSPEPVLLNWWGDVLDFGHFNYMNIHIVSCRMFVNSQMLEPSYTPIPSIMEGPVMGFFLS